jgi:hypothetical protein
MMETEPVSEIVVLRNLNSMVSAQTTVMFTATLHGQKYLD